MGYQMTNRVNGEKGLIEPFVAYKLLFLQVNLTLKSHFHPVIKFEYVYDTLCDMLSLFINLIPAVRTNPLLFDAN
jgi:hypothetical protein